MNTEQIDVSVIILNWNTRDLLGQCLRSLYDTMSGLKFEVVVVDNASADGSVEMVRRAFPQVRLITNAENLGFARANNRAMAASYGRFMLLFNSDAIATSDAIQALVSLAEKEPRAGIVGAQLLNPDRSFQASHTPFPTLWQELLVLTGLGRLFRGRWYPSRGPEDNKGPQVVDYVEGACMLVRRAAFEDVGGMDEGYFMYAEEVDWCYTMRRQGWQVWYQPVAQVIHLGSASSRRRRPQRETDLYRSRVRFFRKYYGGSAARLLKIQICTLTAIKYAVHGVLSLFTGGRCGRPVVPLRRLMRELGEV